MGSLGAGWTGGGKNRVGSDEYVIYAERDLLSVDIFIWEFK